VLGRYLAQIDARHLSLNTIEGAELITGQYHA
jgi:hypothetical protein